MKDWQPIETAPTSWEEKPVDLWVVDRHGQGSRVADCKVSLANGERSWKQPCSEWGWVDVHGRASHWMPLPEAPAQ